MGWYTVKLGNSWAKADGTQVLRFKYYNDSGYTQTLSNISCLLGSGNGKAWASNGSTYSGNGQSCTAVLYYYGTDSEYKTKVSDIGTATVGQSASVAGIKDSNNAYFSDSNKNGKRDAGETGYFPLNGNSVYKVTFSGALEVSSGATVYFAVAKSSGSGQILTAHSGTNFSSQNISSTTTNAKCTISNISITPDTIIPGNGSVTASATGNSGSSKSYQWYNEFHSEISGATSATRENPAAGDYCKITIYKTNYESVTGTTAAVKHYGKPSAPTELTITGSKNDNRYTNREDYTFSWTKSASDGANSNTRDGYEYLICADTDNTAIHERVNKDTNSVTKSASTMTGSPLYIAKGKKLYFKVRTLGSVGYPSDWVKSDVVDIVSAAVVHVNDGTWHEGIAYINKGTASNPNWVETEEVFVKDKDGSWHTSV